jgi:BsuBI/PstI restriction endonuclease domain
MAANQLRGNTVLATDGLGPLQLAVLEKFIPQFAPQAKVLFLRGSDDRPLIFVSGTLQRLDIPVGKLSKLPDVVLHLPKRRLLLLLELNKPISTRRRIQLEQLLAACSARREYVSALSDWRAYRRNGNHAARGTHIWLAEVPEHMIHCNGDKFLGPRPRVSKKPSNS